MWKAAIDLMLTVAKRLPAVWLSELPFEGTPNFWFHAAQCEMQTRDSTSTALRRLAAGQGLPVLTPLEAWLVRRRFEWGAQVAAERAEHGIVPDATVGEVQESLLVRSWETDGCVGFWLNAERDRKPHPENSEGLTPF